MGFADIIIKTLKEFRYTRELQYLALDLLTESIDTHAIVTSARNAGISQRLGYLCEITARAAELRGLADKAHILQDISNKLYSPKYSPQYLNPNSPEFAKRISASERQNEVNQRWNIIGCITFEEIVEWIDLYAINKNV